MTETHLSSTKLKKIKKFFLTIMGIHMSKRSKRKVNTDEKEHLNQQDRTLNEGALERTEYPRSPHQTVFKYTESEGNFPSDRKTFQLQNKETDEVSCCDFAVSTDEHLFEEFIDLSDNSRTNFDLRRWSEGEHIVACREHLGGNKTSYSTKEGSIYGHQSVISMQRGKHAGRHVPHAVHSCTGQQCTLIPGTVTESEDSYYKQAIRASTSDPKFRPWTAKGQRLFFQSNTTTEKDISYEYPEKNQDKRGSSDVNFVFVTNDGTKLESASSLVPTTDTLRSEESNEPGKIKDIARYEHRKNIESISTENEFSASGETERKHRKKRSRFKPTGYKVNVKVNPLSDIVDISLPGHVLGTWN